MLKEAAPTFLELLRETADQHEAAWLALSEGKAQPSSMELFRRRQLKQINRAGGGSFRSW